MSRSFIILVLIIVGCSETEAEPQDHTPRCIPGRVEQCACPDGESGTQTCQDDGRFTACACKPAETSAGQDPGAGPHIDLGGFVPVRLPFARLFLSHGCHDADRYTHLGTTEQLVWEPPNGPRFTLTARDDLTRPSREPEPISASEFALRVYGAENGGEPEILFALRHEGSTCGTSLPRVVNAGLREDGALLLSIETLPAKLPAWDEDIPGESKRAILAWDAESDEVRAVATWEGPTREAPDHMRFMPPR